MRNSALILGFAALILGIGASLLSPICLPCLSLFLGLGAGFLTGVFDKKPDSSEAAKSGALGGLLASIGAVLGQIIGAFANVLLMGPGGASNFAAQMGIPVGPGFEGGYWIGLVGSTVCYSIVDIGLMAGMGALGGLLWWQIVGKNQSPAPKTLE